MQWLLQAPWIGNGPRHRGKHCANAPAASLDNQAAHLISRAVNNPELLANLHAADAQAVAGSRASAKLRAAHGVRLRARHAHEEARVLRNGHQMVSKQHITAGATRNAQRRRDCESARRAYHVISNLGFEGREGARGVHRRAQAQDAWL